MEGQNQPEIELIDASDLSRTGSLAFGVELRYGQRRTAPGGFVRGKTFSAMSGYPHIPCVLLLDDPANELFLSAGLGADRVITLDWRLS